MPSLDLGIDRLLLDSANPRIGQAQNQRESLQKILDDQGSKLAVLAEDIVNEGLSPLERLLVVSEGKSSKNYVVVEGNRRLAALKILSNPNMLASLQIEKALQRKLERIAKDFDPKNVEPVSCFEVADRQDARKWIYTRHTGQNGGKGIVEWSGIAAARFRGSDPAQQALAFVRKHGNLDAAHQALIDESFPITTLDRLLSTREVRSLIGVDVKSGVLNSSFSGAEIIKPLRRIVLDLAEKRVNVSQLKNKTAQVEYVESFGASDRGELKKRGAARSLDSFGTGEVSAKRAPPPKKPASRKAYDPSKRSEVVPRTSKLNVSNAKVAEIYGELKSLDMEDHPHSSAVLLRVFLELSVDSYMRKSGIPDKGQDKNGRAYDKTLNKKLQEVVDHLVNNKGCKRKDFSGVNRALGDKNSPLHVDLLHAYVHNLFHVPKVRDLRSAWDEAEPLFEQIWE